MRIDDEPPDAAGGTGARSGDRAGGDAETRDGARHAHRLDRMSRDLQVLQRVSAEINATLDLEEIYQATLRTLGEVFEFHHATILLLEPDGETLTVVASRGYESQAVGGRVRVGTGVIGIVAQRRTMLHVANLGQQRAYAAAQRRQLVQSGRGRELADTPPVPGLANAESQIAVPLLVRDELIGVFSIESPVRRTFHEHERELVSIVANQIASAINNARLYAERQRAVDALETANASLEARVADRTAALERELRVAEALLRDARSRVEGPLLGGSPAVRALRDAVAREGRSDAPLLLVGPPGCGKEAVARAIHDASPRRGPFIFVSCPELHTQQRPARGDVSADASPLAATLDLAAGGTLFLDAVHELPESLQRSLDALLAAGPAGGVRILVATTRDLEADGRHVVVPPVLQRLAARRLAVPALADRLEDLPALVDHYVRRHARQFGKAIDGVSPESMRRLEAYRWPGNVRELQAVIERATLVSRSSLLEIGDELFDQGLSVGSYRLVARIGAGGMGEVWRASHRLLARPAAVKLTRHDASPGSDREGIVRRFQREAQATATLRSPYTVQLYDFGVSESGSFYYVMELLQGLDLHRIVSQFGPQPAERVVQLLRQACRSLAEAHERGLVHRDIKPGNLFVARLGTEYDFLKVLDFGIVRDRPGDDATQLTGEGVFRGTPAFAAPELVFGDEGFDGRADLYSLACTAYWALTGQRVFRANTPAQMLLHHAQTVPEPPSAVTELPIPPALEHALMACLEKDPGRRPASALVLESLLARVRCESEWTQDRARDWWVAHAPDAVT